MHDLRYGWRALKGAPVVSAVAVLSLGLGIGANTAIFTVLDTLILERLPVEPASRLALLGDGTGRRVSWSNPVWDQVRGRAGQFDGAFAVSTTRFNLASRGESEMVDGLWASGEMFDVLGVGAMLGRTFTPRDDRAGGGPDGPVAVISYGFWQRRFAGAADAIGRSITIERVPFTIVGVTPPGFFGVEVGRTFDVALPIGPITLVSGPRALEQRSTRWLRIMVCLKAGQTADAATALLRTWQPQIREATLPGDWHPGELTRYLREPFRLDPAPNGDSGLRERYQRPLFTIMVVVGLVLLVACANLATLLLARASTRRREIGVQVALGASRIRIARQLLTECLLLSIAGSVLGLVIARWGSRLLVQQLATATNPVSLDLSLDWRTLAFTAAVTISTAILFGTAPALRSARMRPAESLATQTRGVIGDGPSGAGQSLVVVQVALSVVLVFGAGLFVRTFASLATLDVGFQERSILIAAIEVPGSSVPPERRPELFRQLLESAAAVPGVASATFSHVTPLSGNNWNNQVVLPDAPPRPLAESLSYFNMVGAGYFRTYGTPVLSGREFTGADRPGAPPVAIVNEAFARRFNGGRNPIGLRVRHPFDIERRVVGYVKDAVNQSLRGPIPPTLYIPYEQESVFPLSTSVSVRAAAGSPALLARPLVHALTRVHGDLRVTVRPLADRVAEARSQERIVAALSASFGALALLMSALGLYGVTSYGVNRRRAEIGIRLALGAARSGVMALVLRRAFAVTGIGLVLGLGLSLWISRFVAPLLFELHPRDPLTLSVAVAVLGSAAAVAAWLPARRASRIDPARVLRNG